MAGVDRDADPAVGHFREVCQAGNHRHHPGHLLVHTDRRGTWTGRLPTHIEDGGPLRHHGSAVGHGLPVVEEAPPVGERVWCDVQDAHNASGRASDV